MSKYLGKCFHDTIKNSLDQHHVNKLRKDIEDIKLQIIDAAEAKRLPPKIENAGWLYDLFYKNNGYQFIWNEFSDWMSINGITSYFEFAKNYNWGNEKTEYTFSVRPTSWANFDDEPLEEPSVPKWDEMVAKWRGQPYEPKPPKKIDFGGFFTIKDGFWPS
jgi:hypothetical protein